MKKSSEIPSDLELESRIRAMPKAEMHLHLEGAFRWDTVREVHPDGSSFPDVPPWLAGDGRFSDFAEFIEVFLDYLRPATGTSELVERHTYEVLADLAAQNVRYAEILTGVGFHTAGGLSLSEVLGAMERAKRAAESDFSIQSKFFMGLNRHLPFADVKSQYEEVIREAGPRGSGLISGIDLMGDERLCEANVFADVFEDARQRGLRLRAHAGELCGADAVRSTLDSLKVEHLSHGVRAAEDPGLVSNLAERGILLHVCVTSNVSLAVYPDFSSHPLRDLLQAGCKVTLNSDDPVLFGVSITDEYLNGVRHLHLNNIEISRLARNAFQAADLDEKTRNELCAEATALLE